jgi:hypothetical protein
MKMGHESSAKMADKLEFASYLSYQHFAELR